MREGAGGGQTEMPGLGLTWNRARLSFRGMVEKHYRSFVKAVSWRLTGSVDTLVISFLITRQIKWALTISGVELFTKIFLFYVHERVWNKIPFGRVLEPKDKPNFEI
jgi:uncharacterized membrane protein